MTVETEVLVLNSGLAFWLCRPYRGRDDYDDLLQIAFMGIILAFRKFNPEVGEWSSLAAAMAKGQIRAFHIAQGRKKRFCPRALLSLDDPIGDDEDDEATLADIVADDREDPAGFAVARVVCEEIIRAAAPRDRLILRLTAAGYSLREVGAELGISGERVRQRLDRVRAAWPA